MGMSASQARLLSITSRLTNNEFHAQTITNAKLRNADKSIEAGEDYMEALQSKQLMFMNYDDNGEAVKTPLTPAVLYDYAPMKNQYLIQNSGGKFLLSNTDIKNFEETGDLFKFLQKYDLAIDVTEATNDKIKEDWQKMRDGLYADYERKHAEWEQTVNNWSSDYNTDTSLYDKFVDIVGTSNNPKTDCYYRSINDHSMCYLHVLNYLLEYDGSQGKLSIRYCKNSCGDEFRTSAEQGDMADDVSPFKEKCKVLHELSEGIDDLSITCDGSDKFTPYYNNPQDPTNPDADILEWTDDKRGVKDNKNIIQQAIDEGREPTKYEILKSDYKYDPVTKTCTGVKSLKQKLVDLYYIMCCYDYYINSNDRWSVFDPEISYQTVFDEMVDMLINFTEGDLKMVGKKEPPPEPEWKEPDPPKLVEGLAFLRDQEKSQWYTNLWHAMNGSDTSNTVDPINFDNDVDYLDKIPNDIRSEYRFIVENKTKDTKQTNYTEIDKNLEGSAEWLQFALEHGSITLEQAQYFNPSEDSLKAMEMTSVGYKWNNISYKLARDFVSQEDETAIMKAEVLYKKRLRDIKDLDTKFDQQLKKLDVEHNALQTEYDSIKEVLSKNVDRSFKAFS